VIPRFLAYALHSPIGQAQFKISEYGGTKQGLGLDDVRNVQLALPSMNEQERMVRYMDAATGSMIRSIGSINREIDLVREYRTRLVTDVVTGKLDVRGAAAKLPDLPPEAEPLDETEDLLQDETAAEDFEVAEAA
jgi:type I restriction enzyme S subunit